MCQQISLAEEKVLKAIQDQPESKATRSTLLQTLNGSVKKPDEKVQALIDHGYLESIQNGDITYIALTRKAKSTLR